MMEFPSVRREQVLAVLGESSQHAEEAATPVE